MAAAQMGVVQQASFIDVSTGCISLLLERAAPDLCDHVLAYEAALTTATARLLDANAGLIVRLRGTQVSLVERTALTTTPAPTGMPSATAASEKATPLPRDDDNSDDGLVISVMVVVILTALVLAGIWFASRRSAQKTSQRSAQVVAVQVPALSKKPSVVYKNPSFDGPAPALPTSIMVQTSAFGSWGLDQSTDVDVDRDMAAIDKQIQSLTEVDRALPESGPDTSVLAAAWLEERPDMPPAYLRDAASPTKLANYGDAKLPDKTTLVSSPGNVRRTSMVFDQDIGAALVSLSPPTKSSIHFPSDTLLRVSPMPEGSTADALAVYANALGAPAEAPVVPLRPDSTAHRYSTTDLTGQGNPGAHNMFRGLPSVQASVRGISKQLGDEQRPWMSSQVETPSRARENSVLINEDLFEGGANPMPNVMTPVMEEATPAATPAAATDRGNNYSFVEPAATMMALPSSTPAKAVPAPAAPARGPAAPVPPPRSKGGHGANTAQAGGAKEKSGKRNSKKGANKKASKKGGKRKAPENDTPYSRQEAEAFLRSARANGAFVIRPSRSCSAGKVITTLQNGQIKHVQLDMVDGKFSLKNGNQRHASVQALVDFHKQAANRVEGLLPVALVHIPVP